MMFALDSGTILMVHPLTRDGLSDYRLSIIQERRRYP